MGNSTPRQREKEWDPFLNWVPSLVSSPYGDSRTPTSSLYSVGKSAIQEAAEHPFFGLCNPER